MTQIDNNVIISVVRTAIGSFGGTFPDFRSPDLAKRTYK